MSWLPDYVKRNMKVLKCFICNSKIVDKGAEMQYSYQENGKHKLGKVMICTKCADELDKKNMDIGYDEPI